MDRIRVVLLCCTVVIVSFVVLRSGAAQGPDPLRGLNEQQKQTLAEPFKGITANGQVTADLFQIRHTGVSTSPVRAAAEAFLKALTEEQRKRLMFPVEDREWRIWINTPGPARQGVSFKEMSEMQREAAFDLLRESLSARGLQKTGDIMKLNETLAEITNNFTQFGQWAYWMTVMGTPSDTEPWGWQLDGHHCIINYFVLGDQVVMTPTFMGSEPVRADAGKFKGTVVLQDEQNKGLKLFTALAVEQRAKAALRTEKGGDNTLAGAYRDNAVLDYAGIRATDLDQRQRDALIDLIAEYVNNQKEGHARIRMEDVRKHIDNTYFAWIGNSDPEGVFYYRVQSPVILIEFDHQRSVASPGPTATRNHIHTVVRTPNGNDYGKDLLRQHYAQHPHGTR